MLLLDVNVLVYAFRKDSPHHKEIRIWFDEITEADEVFGVSDLVFSGLMRIVTHPRVFKVPSKMAEVISFIEKIREFPNFLLAIPSERHWSIFVGLCRSSGIKGNLVPDAYHAATAIEVGATWISTDRDYSRFSGLSWKHPLIKP